MEIKLTRNEPGPIQSFTIYGKPGSKQSVRSSIIEDKITGKNKIHQYQEKTDVDNQNYLGFCIKRSLPFGWELWTGAIIVRKLHYLFYPPKDKLKDFVPGVQILVTTKPDLTDNLNKMLFDAMNNIVYVDDKQVAGIEDCYKYYSLEPKTILTLEHLE